MRSKKQKNLRIAKKNIFNQDGINPQRISLQALKIQIPEPAQKVRLLAKHAETLQSHSFHLFFLVTSDFLNVPSVKECEGVGAVEAPRGILYHCYRINEEGKIDKSDCVIPTNQNNANIYNDLKKLVEESVAQGKGEEEIANLSQMLVRAYDPCISCSVH